MFYAELLYAGNLTTVVEGPNGELPVSIKQTDVGKYSVSFIPEHEGKLQSSYSGFLQADKWKRLG